MQCQYKINSKRKCLKNTVDGDTLCYHHGEGRLMKNEIVLTEQDVSERMEDSMRIYRRMEVGFNMGFGICSDVDIEEASEKPRFFDDEGIGHYK